MHHGNIYPSFQLPTSSLSLKSLSSLALTSFLVSLCWCSLSLNYRDNCKSINWGQEPHSWSLRFGQFGPLRWSLSTAQRRFFDEREELQLSIGININNRNTVRNCTSLGNWQVQDPLWVPRPCHSCVLCFPRCYRTFVMSWKSPL